MMNHMQKHWYRETEFGSKDILSIGIQCGEFAALSKWLPATSPLVRPILHIVGLLITMRWPRLLCKPHVTPPCHVSIEQLHTHWKYPLDLEFIQTWSATNLPTITDLSTASMLFTVRSSPGHANHVAILMVHHM